jgi:CHAT domain-containing protein
MKPHKTLNRFFFVLVTLSLTWHFSAGRTVSQSVPPSPQSLDDRTRGVTLYREALGLLQSGNLSSGIEKLLQAEPLLRRTGDIRGRAYTLNALGTAYTMLGEPLKGLPYLREALAIRRDAGDLAAAFVTYKAIGEAFVALGHYQQALDSDNEARRTFKSLGYTNGEAQILFQIAMVYDQLNEKQKALLYCYNALNLIQNSDPRQVIQNYILIGTLYSDLGLFPEALASFDKTLTYLRGPDVEDAPGGIALVQGFMAIAYARSGDLPKSIELFSLTRDAFHQLNDREGEAAALNHIGGMQELQGQRAQAEASYTQALQLVRVNDKALLSDVLNNLGRVNRLLGQSQKALEFLNQALALRKQGGDLIGQADTLYNVGAILEAKEPGRALESYREAIALVENNRVSTVVEELRKQLASETVNLYRRAVVLLLRTHQEEEAFTLSERARARAFLDLIGNARPTSLRTSDPKFNEEWQKQLRELGALQRSLRAENSKAASQRNAETIRLLQEDIAARQLIFDGLLNSLRRMNPEYASFHEVDTQTLPQVQALLDRETTLVSYFISTDKIIAFIIGRDSFRTVELPVTEGELRTNLIAFYRSFENLSNPPTAILRQLHAQLFAPIQQFISTPVVGIVPHGVLHYVPFAALFDGQRYLMDKHTLFSLPSTSLFKYIKEKRKPAGRNILSLSLSRPEGLPFLRFADPAAQRIAGLYDKQALTGAVASESALKARAGDSDILFIAAHARLNSYSPMFSQLILSPDEENDGMLEVHEVYELDLKKTNLVVLSACQTQLGEHSKGDDITGLNRAFIYAGTPSVAASLWSVKEEQTGALMYNLMKNYRDGMSKAAALQAAQRSIRLTNPHPYFWAAFVLTGDPGK